MIKLPGTLAPGCQIFIDGQPAQLADLRVGDVASVRGTIYPGYTTSVQADVVRVTRAGPSTQPAPTTTRAAGGS
jgi:hypothetical protein